MLNTIMDEREVKVLMEILEKRIEASKSTIVCSQREPGSWKAMIMNDEVSANAIMKRATKHYIVVIQPIENLNKGGRCARRVAAGKRTSGRCSAQIGTDKALDDIYKESTGIPRRINRICEKCLMYASQQGKRLIDEHLVHYIIEHEMLGGDTR